MLLLPERFWLTSGVAEGETELNAFDNALLRAGIGNYNLVKVSSILPKMAELQESGPDLPEGTLLAVVLGVATSAQPGSRLCSCVGVGRSRESHGIIMEYSGDASVVEAERIVKCMLTEAFDRRGLDLDSVLLRACDSRVEKAGCTVASVVLW